MTAINFLIVNVDLLYDEQQQSLLDDYDLGSMMFVMSLSDM